MPWGKPTHTYTTDHFFKSEENVGELGRTSLKSRHAVNVIRHWFNTKYVKNMFSLMYRKGDNNPTHMSWTSNVKMLLQSIDLYEDCILNQDA